VKIYCATTNPGKLHEFRAAIERFSGGLLDLEVLPQTESIPPCEETGATFEENAVQKAVYYSGHVPGPLFADDSGLEVQALGGAPGVLSARFAGAEASDEENNRLLLAKLSGVADRAAQFVCVIAVAEQGRLIGTFRGAVKGRILEEPRGANGFGYDPLFYYDAFGRTFGEVSAEQKLQVSHRARALEKMVRFLTGASASDSIS